MTCDVLEFPGSFCPENVVFRELTFIFCHCIDIKDSMVMSINVDVVIAVFCKPDMFDSGYKVVKVFEEISIVQVFA